MCALSSADRVPGYEPVGQRFESSRARQKKDFEHLFGVFFLSSFTTKIFLAESSPAKPVTRASQNAQTSYLCIPYPTAAKIF